MVPSVKVGNVEGGLCMWWQAEETGQQQKQRPSSSDLLPQPDPLQQLHRCQSTATLGGNGEGIIQNIRLDLSDSSRHAVLLFGFSPR